jgi:VanZ family protein
VPPDPSGFEGSDKIGHLLAYGSLMLWFSLLYRSLPARLAYGAGFVALGVVLEFVQGTLGYRSFEVADMAANTLGVLLGWAAAHAGPRILRR